MTSSPNVSTTLHFTGLGGTGFSPLWSFLMSKFFDASRNASSFAADVRGWNTAAVTDREEMFAGAAAWLALFDPAPSFVSHLGVAYPDLPLDAKEETSVLLEARLDAPAVVYFLAVPGAAGSPSASEIEKRVSLSRSSPSE